MPQWVELVCANRLNVLRLSREKCIIADGASGESPRNNLPILSEDPASAAGK